MALFDSEEEFLRSLAQNATGASATTSSGTQRQAGDTTQVATTEIVPGPASGYAGPLEQLAGKLGGTGDYYGDLLRSASASMPGESSARAFAQKYWPNYSWDSLPQSLRDEAMQATGTTPAPTYDSGAQRARTGAYASDLDTLAGEVLGRGRAELAGPSQSVIDRLTATAENPIDDELERYFGDQFRRRVGDELGRTGLVGQGRGADLLIDAENRYAMDRRAAADERRMNAANTARGLRSADLDAALKSYGAGTGLKTGAYQARDAAENMIYGYDLDSWNRGRTAPFEDAMRLGQVGAAEAGLRQTPANIYGTLYGLDTARLARGVTQNQATRGTNDITGATTGTQTGTTSGTTTQTGTGTTTGTPGAGQVVQQLGGLSEIGKAVGSGLPAVLDVGKDILGYFGY